MADYKSIYKPIQCPRCNSKKIFCLRIDSSYLPENSDKEYSKEELELSSCDKNDLLIHHCLKCDNLWED